MDGGGRGLAGGEADFYEGGNGGGRGGDRRGFRGTTENAKTKLCMRWMSPEGCRFGDRCNFAHGEHELRKLPPRGGDGPGRGGRGGRGGGGYGGFGGGGGGGGWQDGFGDNRGQPGFDDFYRGGYGMQRPPFPGGPAGFPGGFPQGGMPPGGAPNNGPGNGYPPLGNAQGPPGSGLAVGQGRTPHESVENMTWIASGCPVTGPGGWTQYRCQETGEYYYHNHRTNATTWDKPAEWGP